MVLGQERFTMTNVLIDTSEDALRRVSEEHYFDSFLCFSVVPDVEVYQGEDMIRLASPGIPNRVTNTVLRCRLSTGEVDSAIEETNDYFRSRGVMPHWRLCPGDLPTDLEQRLVTKGFALGEERPAMAVDLKTLNENIRTREGLKIERIDNAETMKEKHGWIRRLGEGKTLGALIMDLWTRYGFDLESDMQHYLGLINGEPVSWASVFYATGVAGIYAVGTVPAARRQGFGSAITLRALLDARERGFRVGMLQSSQMGINLYRRLGFTTCFTIKTYIPSSPRPE